MQKVILDSVAVDSNLPVFLSGIKKSFLRRCGCKIAKQKEITPWLLGISVQMSLSGHRLNTSQAKYIILPTNLAVL